ncbi:MAG TPA: penicillin-binding transpeptidase domain-containing protein [Rhodothermales bacterium]|nr:penicillin-binding transpeptidase domain-containing protein [Rhodothermales bacterium]
MSARATILGRLYVVTAALLLLPAGVVARMVQVQVGQGSELREQGERQASSFVDVPAQRGAIYDHAGRALAANNARYEVALDPTVAGYDDRADALYEMLGEFTGRGASHFRRRVRDRASRQYVLLVRDLGEAEKEQLDAADIPGLLVTGRFGRRYTYGRTAAHLLGHVDADLSGAAGLEAQYDDVLRGTPGRQAVSRDRLGHVEAIVGGAFVEPRNGESLVLTVDLVRQTIMEEELARGVAEAGAAWGTAIAMDPRTGAVLAMANVPTYDPGAPGMGGVEAQRNHAVTDRIEPGSTFKLVTAVAALESGTLRMTDTVDTGPGWAVFHGRTMRDSHPVGRVTFADAIAVSSNVAMARTAMRMGPDPLYRTARALGFGSPTLIDLPGEVGGFLKRPEQWGPLTLPWMSTGYEVEATPLQILAAYCALANGGLLVQPHVVAERRDARGQTVWTAPTDSVRRAFSERTARQLMPAFERVVSEDGTARRAAVPGLRVAGKTGTAQTATAGGYTARYRATFVGVFPAEAPEVAIVVVLDNPVNGAYGGIVSAPIFSSIASRWIGTFPTIAARVAPPVRIPARTTAALPTVMGMPVELAAARLRADGFAAPEAPETAWRPVAAVVPGAGARAVVGRAVNLTAAPRGGAPRVPDLRGLSARQAVAWLASMGVRARVVGSGAVATQSARPGSALPREVTLTLR